MSFSIILWILCWSVKKFLCVYRQNHKIINNVLKITWFSDIYSQHVKGLISTNSLPFTVSSPSNFASVTLL